MRQKPFVFAILPLFAAASAFAGEGDPPAASLPPAPSAAVPAPATPPPATTAPAAPEGSKDQSVANKVIQDAAGSKNCYSGFHTSFDYNITGYALTALGRKVIEPGGLCDQYREYSADMPFEIGVPLLPGVTVNIDKLCKMVQRPPCPEPSADTAQPAGPDNK